MFVYHCFDKNTFRYSWITLARNSSLVWPRHGQGLIQKLNTWHLRYWSALDYCSCIKRFLLTIWCFILLPILALSIKASSLHREWKCSWNSADRRCSNYIWVINNLLPTKVRLITEIWWYALFLSPMQLIIYLKEIQYLRKSSRL